MPLFKPLVLFLCGVSGFFTSTSLFTLVVLCITVFICISYSCFGHFKYLSPHNSAVSVFLCVHPSDTSLPSLTLSLHIFCVLLQVKEEDEDTAEGAKESTTVLYLLYNKLNSMSKDHTYLDLRVIYLKVMVNCFGHRNGNYSKIETD